jgi:poly(A) polymerase
MRQLETVFARTCPAIVSFPDGTWVTQDDGSDAFLIGDYNFGDSEENNLLRADLRDSWSILHPSDPGFTVDPSQNGMAEVTSTNRRRYDRVLIRGNRWEPESIRLLGQHSTKVTLSDLTTKVELWPSDHYGLECVIRFLDDSDLALKTVMSSAGLIESDEATQKRSAALATLNRLFTKWLVSEGAPAPSNNVLPLGSYSYGVHSSGGDIDVLCVADVASKVFFDSFSKFLVKKKEDGVESVRVVLDALVPVVKTVIAGFKIDILYCGLPTGHISKSDIHFDVAKELLAPGKLFGDDTSIGFRALDDKSVLSLNGFRDTQLILSCFPDAADMFVFRQVLRFIRLWAQRRGVYSNTLCYFGGFGWSILVAHSLQLLKAAQPNTSFSASDLIRHFFKTYASWNWKEQPVSIVPAASSSYKLDSIKDVMTVLTCTKPYKNSARNISRSTRTVIKAELARAVSLVESQPVLSNSVVKQLVEPCSNLFVGPDHYKSFLKISVSALNETDYFRWKGFVESRLIALLLKLDMSGLLTHLIPRAFENPDSPFPFSCYFLVGLKKFQTQESAAPDTSSSSSSSQQPQARLDFANVVHQFESMLNEWPGKNDQMDLLVKHLKVEGLPVESLISQLNTVSSGPVSPSGVLMDEPEEDYPEEEPEEDNHDGQESSGSGDEISAATDASSSSSSAKKVAKKSASKKGKKKGVEEPAPKKKIRHSVDVFNRIKWDAQMSLQNWVIGYEDRFVGIIEVPIAEFDHSTIPWHRVRIFKRDGEIVWDRLNRIDRVFGPEEEEGQ